jgi:hypothetical protein
MCRCVAWPPWPLRRNLLVSAAVSVGAVFGEHDEQVVVLLLERLVPEQPQPAMQLISISLARQPRFSCGCADGPREPIPEESSSGDVGRIGDMGTIIGRKDGTNNRTLGIRAPVIEIRVWIVGTRARMIGGGTRTARPLPRALVQAQRCAAAPPRAGHSPAQPVPSTHSTQYWAVVRSTSQYFAVHRSTARYLAVLRCTGQSIGGLWRTAQRATCSALLRTEE